MPSREGRKGCVKIQEELIPLTHFGNSNTIHSLGCWMTILVCLRLLRKTGGCVWACVCVCVCERERERQREREREGYALNKCALMRKNIDV